MNKYKAIIFDMDGLMFDTERLTKKLWKEACKEFGIDVSEEIFFKVIGLKREDGRKILEQELGKKFDYDEVRKVKDNLYFKYLEQNGTPIKKGLLELISFLEKNNIPKAIASSTSRNFIHVLLEKANILEHFPIIVAGDEIIKGKPNPDIFLKASEKLKVEQSKCLVLEDSNAGIKAANSAKMDVIMIPDLLEPNEENKKIILKKCNSLLDVIEYLK